MKVPLWSIPSSWLALMSVAAYIEWRVRRARAKRAHDARREGRRDVFRWQGVR